MPIETLAYVYTSQDEIERLISETGVQSRTRDLAGSDNPNYWIELIAEATDTINQWVGDYYDEADMADSRWVRARASWIALTLLCRRRGNPVPASILDRYEEIMEDLRLVRYGLVQIPRLPTRAGLLPTMSNIRIDDRFYSRKIRVNPSISVGPGGGQQDLDWWWSYDWF